MGPKVTSETYRRDRDWSIRGSTNDETWRLAWEVYRRQAERILEEIQPDPSLLSERNEHSSPPGTLWTPLVDLNLGGLVTAETGAPSDEPSPYRIVHGFAEPEAGGLILRRGMRLEFQLAARDATYLGFGANYWRPTDAQTVSTDYIVTAGEWRWGGESRLLDALIVRIDEPLLTDLAAARRLMDDLYSIVESARGRPM